MGRSAATAPGRGSAVALLRSSMAFRLTHQLLHCIGVFSHAPARRRVSVTAMVVVSNLSGTGIVDVVVDRRRSRVHRAVLREVSKRIANWWARTVAALAELPVREVYLSGV